MLYNLFRFFLWVMYVCFYRRIYFINAKAIPKKKPMMFASNHGNGFMDPILIAALQWRPVWFWARAGELKNDFKGGIMRRVHGLPIYRQEEGVENMHKNEDTFQTSRELMYKGDTIYLAPEGKCNADKRILPLKTGAARLAFKMMEEKNWEIDVMITPTGVNYTHHTLFRASVYIKFGEAIAIQDYKELYLKDNFEAVTKVTADLSAAIKAEMIYIENIEDEALTEKLLLMARNNMSRNIFPMYSGDETLFRLEQKIAQDITDMDLTKKAALEKEVAAYDANLQKEKVSDYAVANKNKRNLFWVLIGFPIWILGTLCGRLPHILGRDLRNKFVPFREFSTSFAFTGAFLMWIAWSIIVMLVGAFLIGWWTLLLPFGMVALQTYAYHYADYSREWRELNAYKDYKNKMALSEQRGAIMGRFLNE